jgi:hypothetical protein
LEALSNDSMRCKTENLSCGSSIARDPSRHIFAP